MKGADQLGKKDVTQGQADSTLIPPDQKVNKVNELTYYSINIGIVCGTLLTDLRIIGIF